MQLSNARIGIEEGQLVSPGQTVDITIDAMPDKHFVGTVTAIFTIAPYLTGMNTLAMFTMTEESTPDVQYQLERKRTLLMPVLYFVILTISQLSNMLLAWFAYPSSSFSCLIEKGETT